MVRTVPVALECSTTDRHVLQREGGCCYSFAIHSAECSSTQEDKGLSIVAAKQQCSEA